MKVKILIHIGPPKTGTSAVQFCLQDDRKRLAKLGILYPEHAIDVNGISSGNLRAIYDVVNEDRVLNVKKVSELLSFCRRSNFHTLLLSSEFFFERLSELAELLPSAIFIAYVRNPLHSFESLYNQSVKRHHNIKPINQAAHLPRVYLAKLDKFIEQFTAERFILRAYSSRAFDGGTIITDFYKILDIAPPNNVVRQINSSYSFEALEFKRWLNIFCSPQIAVKADHLLQAFSSGIQRFTLLDDQVQQKYKVQAYNYVDYFSKKYNVYQSAVLLSDIKFSSPRPYVEQGLSFAQFKLVADYLQQKDEQLYRSICQSLYLATYHSCFKSDFGQYITRDYKLSQVNNMPKWKLIISKLMNKLLGRDNPEYNILSNTASDDLVRLRANLKIATDISDVDLLRELAVLAESNNDIGLAYRLMYRAQKLRPNGPLIKTKLKYYAQRIENESHFS